MRHVMVVQAGAPQLGVFEIEPDRFDEVQDCAGHGAQADRRSGVAGDSRRIEAQVRRGCGRYGGVCDAQHHVGHGHGVAVGVGHEFIRSVV